MKITEEDLICPMISVNRDDRKKRPAGSGVLGDRPRLFLFAHPLFRLFQLTERPRKIKTVYKR